jgi:hypothetical protein
MEEQQRQAFIAYLTAKIMRKIRSMGIQEG